MFLACPRHDMFLLRLLGVSDVSPPIEICDIVIQVDVPCVEIHHGFHDFLDEAKPVNIFDTSGG